MIDQSIYAKKDADAAKRKNIRNEMRAHANEHTGKE